MSVQAVEMLQLRLKLIAYRENEKDFTTLLYKGRKRCVLGHVVAGHGVS